MITDTIANAPRRGWAALAMLALVCVCTVVAPPTRAQGQAPANAPIKIAALLGFSGPASLQATSAWIGLRMGVKEINDAGGLLGRRVELIQADDQFQPAQ